MFQTQIERLLGLVDLSNGIEFGFEVGLANRLANNASPSVVAWCQLRIGNSESRRPVGRLSNRSGKVLSKPEIKKIATSGKNRLGGKVQELVDGPVRGLVEALSQRDVSKDNTIPEVAFALAICGDGLDLVVRMFKAYAGDSASIFDMVERTLIERWRHVKNLPVLANVFLWRWEFHLFQVDAKIEKAADLVGLLEVAERSESPRLKALFWDCCVCLVRVHLARNPDRAGELVEPVLLECMARELARSCGEQAARLAMAIYAKPRFRDCLEPVRSTRHGAIAGKRASRFGRRSNPGSAPKV